MLTAKATVLNTTPAMESAFGRLCRVEPTMPSMNAGIVNNHARSAAGPVNARTNPIAAKIALASPKGLVFDGSCGNTGAVLDMLEEYTSPRVLDTEFD
jgi:hypothetical protein